MTGHHHLTFPGPKYSGAGIDPVKGTLLGKPAVMGGFWGSHLGVIDLMLSHEGGAWRIVASGSEVRPISERVERKTRALVESQTDVEDAVRKTHEETLEYIRRHNSSIRFGSWSITHRPATSSTIAATVCGPTVAT